MQALHNNRKKVIVKSKRRTCLKCGCGRSMTWRPSKMFIGNFVEKAANSNNSERMLCSGCYNFEIKVRQIDVIIFFISVN